MNALKGLFTKKKKYIYIYFLFVIAYMLYFFPMECKRRMLRVFKR